MFGYPEGYPGIEADRKEHGVAELAVECRNEITWDWVPQEYEPTYEGHWAGLILYASSTTDGMKGYWNVGVDGWARSFHELAGGVTEDLDSAKVAAVKMAALLEWERQQQERIYYQDGSEEERCL